MLWENYILDPEYLFIEDIVKFDPCYRIVV